MTDAFFTQKSIQLYYFRDRGPVLESNYVSPAKAHLTDKILGVERAFIF